MSLSKDRRYWKTEADQSANGGRVSAGACKYRGVRRGLLVAVGEDGTPKVDFEGNPDGQPIPAVSTVATTARDAGREAVLAFEDEDGHRPILLGLVQPPSPPSAARPAEVYVDGEQITLSAEKEVVLRCGHSSITLTRAGKILIRGKYLLSRSSGVNRIKGGSVQIN